MSSPDNYQGIHCKHVHCETGKIYAAGGFWSKIFDVEGRKFSTVTCKRCKHTEFFKADKSTLANKYDLFVT